MRNCPGASPPLDPMTSHSGIRGTLPPGVVIIRSDLALNGPGVFAISLAKGLFSAGSPSALAVGSASTESLALASRHGIEVLESPGLCKKAGLEAFHPAVLADLVRVGVRLSRTGPGEPQGPRPVVFHGLNYRSAIAGKAAALMLRARGTASGAVATAVGYGAESAVRFMPFPIVAISAHGSGLLERAGRKPDAVIGCGTADPDEIRSLDARVGELRRDLRNRFGWPQDAFVACVMASHNPLKGTTDVPELLSRSPGLHAVILGDGPLRGEVSVRALSLEVEGRLALVHATPSRLEYLRGADFLLHPSRAETFCMAASEAMSLGLPVVAYSSGAVPKTLGCPGSLHPDRGESGTTGILVPAGAIGRLAEAASFLSENRCAAREMGQRGAAVARNRDRLSRTVSDYLRVYCSVVIKSCHA